MVREEWQAEVSRPCAQNALDLLVVLKKSAAVEHLCCGLIQTDTAIRMI
jgi:hypothetical protein